MLLPAQSGENTPEDQSSSPLTPQEGGIRIIWVIDIRLTHKIRNGRIFHLLIELIENGMQVPEQHHAPTLAGHVVPDALRARDRSVPVEMGLALDDLVNGTHGQL